VGKEFDNINPATEEVLGQAADAGHEDLEMAIAAARRAFDETRWPPTSRSGSAAWNSSRRAWPTSASRSAPSTLT